jgi:hypothetical protein
MMMLALMYNGQKNSRENKKKRKKRDLMLEIKWMNDEWVGGTQDSQKKNKTKFKVNGMGGTSLEGNREHFMITYKYI